MGIRIPPFFFGVIGSFFPATSFFLCASISDHGIARFSRFSFFFFFSTARVSFGCKVPEQRFERGETICHCSKCGSIHRETLRFNR